MEKTDLEKQQQTIYFESLNYKNIQDLLSVWDLNHCILISDLLNEKDNDWSRIDINKILINNDFELFESADYSDAFKYIEKQVINYNKLESYFIIIEKCIEEFKNKYLIRGIVRKDNKEYSVAFNPEYQKTIPKDVWDRVLRYSGREEDSYSYVLKK